MHFPGGAVKLEGHGRGFAGYGQVDVMQKYTSAPADGVYREVFSPSAHMTGVAGGHFAMPPLQSQQSSPWKRPLHICPLAQSWAYGSEPNDKLSSHGQASLARHPVRKKAHPCLSPNVAEPAIAEENVILYISGYGVSQI